MLGSKLTNECNRSKEMEGCGMGGAHEVVERRLTGPLLSNGYTLSFRLIGWGGFTQPTRISRVTCCGNSIVSTDACGSQRNSAS